MVDIKIGYDEPMIVTDLLTDGSKVYAVKMDGDNHIIFHCVNKQAAENLRSVLYHSVIETEVII